MKNTTVYTRFLVPLALAAVVTGCASNPELDPREVQQARRAIEEAKEVNAGRHAAGTLARAEERLNMAQQAIDNGREEQARHLVQQAAVLAELAEARALERDSEQALAQIRENLAALQERIE